MVNQQDLTAQQEKLGQSIEQLIRNFKRDPKDRKTKTYYSARLSHLQELWLSFNANHIIIMDGQEIPTEHDYFAKDYYNGIKDLVDSYSEIFKIECEGSTPGLPSTLEATNLPLTHEKCTPKSTSIKVLIKTQNALMDSLRELKVRVMKDDIGAHSKSFYRGKAKLISERLDIIKDIEKQLSASTEQVGSDSTERFLIFEEEMRELIDELEDAYQVDTALSTNENHDVPLPKIQIPKFEGKFAQWTQFKELFIELIHKRQMSDVQKMYYLSTFMAGEAKNLIKHLSMAPENYKIAWEIVTSRYDNKRLLVTELMNKFLSQPNTTSESAAALKELLDVTIECMHGLKAQGISVEEWDILVAHLIIKKLDRTTHTAFEQALVDNRNPVKLNTVLKFLEHRFQSLESLGKSGKIGPIKTTASVVKAGLNIFSCTVCNGGSHHLYACAKFKEDPVISKWQWVKKLNICSNCLKYGHKVVDCKSSQCKLCHKKHHTMLHPKFANQEETQLSSQSNTQSKFQPTSTTTSSLLSGDKIHNNNYVLLGTARVIIAANNGQQIECRAILDSGSQINVVTEGLIKKLNAQTNTYSLQIEGIGKTTKYSRHRVNITVQSRISNFTTAVEAHVLPQIVSKQPSQEINTSNWNLPSNIEQADPNFYSPNKIDLLLGAEFYHQLLCTGKLSIGENLPILQNSVFGWIVAGRVQQPEESTVVCGVCTNDELDEAIANFWKQEETTEPCTTMTIEERQCEEHFTFNTAKTETGRFIVRLPFAGNVDALGDSKGLAFNRLLALERRLSKNSDMQKEYIDFMEQYEKLGHMTEINLRKLGKPHYFIPHHCIMRPESTSTKLRVVFDASAKTTSGVSLNELMHTGRTVQSELFSILLRFRMPRFVFKTDIEKMYRQILIHQDDRMLQLIMWRKDTEQPIKYFQLNTVTYGTRAAPFLATRCLEKLAQENMKRFPAGASALKHNFYVDDGLAGADSIGEALEIQNQLTTILKAAGMNPRKWSANCSRLLQGVAVEDQEINFDFDHNSNESIKTLGLRWLPTTDEFCIRAAVNTEPNITKRQVTSELARIFDPLGLVAPIVVTAKIFIQQLWSLQIDWDVPIPSELQAKWLDFRNNLQALNNVKIPRHVFNHQARLSIQLHAFCDASEKAYGACIYVRAIKGDKSNMTRILCS